MSDNKKTLVLEDSLEVTTKKQETETIVVDDNNWDIVWENVNKTYPNGKEALRNINLTIKQSEFVAIIGLSGAGKTTLLKTVNQINDISSGTLTVGPHDVMKLKGKKLRKFRSQVGIVFQGYNLINNISVMQNILTARLPKMDPFRAFFGLYSSRDIKLSYLALSKVNILENAYDLASDLSGGQMQRVALARTLAQEPKIILADEPVGALDPIMAKSVMDGFLFVNKLDKITVLANLHHVDLALQYADRIIGVRDGEIVFDGASSEVNLGILKNIYGEQLEQFDEAQFAETNRKRAIIQTEIQEKIQETLKQNALEKSNK